MSPLVNICPATVESHALYLCPFSWYYTYSLYTPSPTGSGFSLMLHTSHTKIKTHFILQSMPWFWQTIHLESDILTVSTHGCKMTHLYVPVTCLYLQCHDTISCQTCCYLIFWNVLVCLSEVGNSKHGTRNTSTTGSATGMNTDMPLILKTNNAVGVTDEVREITWFHK